MGTSISRVPSGFSTRPSIFGIISPRFVMMTREPILSSMPLMMLVLTRLALCTVVPARRTGSTMPMGVKLAPDSLHSISRSVEMASSRLNLKAICFSGLGARQVLGIYRPSLDHEAVDVEGEARRRSITLAR